MVVFAHSAPYSLSISCRCCFWLLYHLVLTGINIRTTTCVWICAHVLVLLQFTHIYTQIHSNTLSTEWSCQPVSAWVPAHPRDQDGLASIYWTHTHTHTHTHTKVINSSLQGNCFSNALCSEIIAIEPQYYKEESVYVCVCRLLCRLLRCKWYHRRILFMQNLL